MKFDRIWENLQGGPRSNLRGDTLIVSRKVRWLIILVATAAVFGGIVFLSLYFAASYEPAFYRKAMEIDPAALEKASDRMLQQTTALVGAVNQEEPWEALFTAEQINGWLAVDMVKNHPHLLPPMLHDPRVVIDSKEITLACRVERNGSNAVLSLTVIPYVPEKNVLALQIVKARAGLIPLPLGNIIGKLSEAAREMQIPLAWRRAGNDPVAMFSLPPTEKDRTVCVETLRLGDGEVYLAGRSSAATPKEPTEPEPSSEAEKSSDSPSEKRDGE